MGISAQKETVEVHVIVVLQELITEHGDQCSERDNKGACDCGVAGVDHGTWGPGLRAIPRSKNQTDLQVLCCTLLMLFCGIHSATVLF